MAALLPLPVLTILLLTSTGGLHNIGADAQNLDETRLFHELLANYSKLVRPVVNHFDVVNVTLGITLQEFRIDVNENEIVQTIWMNYEWTDPRLKWVPEDYGDLNSVRLMPDQLWMPDIMVYNMLPSPRLDWHAPTPVVVSPEGSLLYVSPASLRTHCRREYVWYDDYDCQIKFGSWTYSGVLLDLTVSDSAVDTSSLVTNPMWELLSASVKRNVVMYDCCPETYVDITVELHLRHRRFDKSGGKWSVWPNLPAAVSLILSLAGFLVPVTSQQKLTLPCLALVTTAAAVITEFGLNGDYLYRAHFMRAYHVYAYAALACVLWTVLMVALGRPRTLPLPGGLRRCLRGPLAAACCLASPPLPEDKTTCHEWTALAELLDRLAGAAYLILIIIGSVLSSQMMAY